MNRMACALALAAGTGSIGLAALPAIAAPSPAKAAAGLQISIVPVKGAVSNDTAIPLDVKFHGGNITIIELFVDGVQLTHQPLTTKDGRGAVHFSLDPSLLTEGAHDVLVKAYEADGTCASTTTSIVVGSADLNTLTRFEWPKRNAEVQGIVPIKIKIDPSIMDPYVTYTVDNDFLAFRNYAPYVYNWDTAKSGNGIHTIGIEVMDGRTLQVVQKLTLAVHVKNVGGFTSVAPAPSAGRVDNGSVVDTVQGVAASAIPEPSLVTKEIGTNLARTRAHAQPGLRITANAFPGARRGGISANSAPVQANRDHASASPFISGLLNIAQSDPSAFVVRTFPTDASAAFARSNTPPKAHPNGRHIAPGLSAVTDEPGDLMFGQEKASVGLARQTTHFRRMGGIALRPGTERRAVRGTASPAGLPGFHGLKPKTFDVAYNNTLINFDVPPRVENGLPLAPFRAIFEHTGGTVKWFNESKLVRAFDSEHEIEIKIGNPQATVNNTPMSLEVAPYIDRGRTIIPLSFIRDAMGLKVTFDEASGHLTIERK